MKLAAIDLNLLVALDALLSERNVTRAAALVGRSQPAMSHALNRARELFKDPLLVRVGSAFDLTARARLVAPKIHRLLRELGSVLDVHQDFGASTLESVTIGATDYVGFVLIPHVLQILQRVAPRLSVRLRALEGLDALEPVTSGVFDLALGTFPQVPAGLRSERLFDDRFVCLRRADARATPTPTVQQFAALAHVLVVSPSAGQGPVDYALARAGYSRHIAAYVPHFLVAPSVVARTDLVLTTGKRIAEQFAPVLGLEVFACPLPLKPFGVQMIWHPRTEHDSVGIWLRAILREAVAALLSEQPRPRTKPRKARRKTRTERSP